MDQHVFDTSEICYQQGVRHAIFSPGSRNAALSVSFHRNKKINTRVILDERSAGFIALGIAQQTNKPVVLCCTSGTALLNYGPAVAEAFFQRIPLIILSADRPPEWVDQWDGQTIRQNNPFQQHIRKYYDLPVDRSHKDAAWEYKRKIASAVMEASHQQGPVHINAPFREPFYPDPFEEWLFSDITALKWRTGDSNTFQDTSLWSAWDNYQRKVIVLGQQDWNKDLIDILSLISDQLKIPVINEITGNGHGINGVIKHQDLFLLESGSWQNLMPDLIITVGLSTLSKNLKKMLRSSEAEHWHIGNSNDLPGDTFKKLSQVFQVTPQSFFGSLVNHKPQDSTFQKAWQQQQRKAELVLDRLQDAKYAEFSAFNRILKDIPDHTILHLSNSMTVRYANFLGNLKPNIEVFCNRGTSGIDGTNSTAVGHALSSEKQVILLTGDLSFLYDRNAFLHEYDLSNLRVIVFNNFGGGIFDLIPGPSQLELSEKETHFTTPHHRDLKYTAADAGMLYFKANDEVTLELALNDFYERSDLPKLLEIQTASKTNIEVYQQIKKSLS